MTEELFLGDSYLREFEAVVVELSGREVILDRTAFYPGGGGQPPDRGTLGIGPVHASVVDARREGRQVVHVLDNPIPDTVRELEGAWTGNGVTATCATTPPCTSSPASSGGTSGRR